MRSGHMLFAQQNMGRPYKWATWGLQTLILSRAQIPESILGKILTQGPH